jgi:hypothetical protein
LYLTRLGNPISITRQALATIGLDTLLADYMTKLGAKMVEKRIFLNIYGNFVIFFKDCAWSPCRAGDVGIWAKWSFSPFSPSRGLEQQRGERQKR